jgi:hypothetical protein
MPLACSFCVLCELKWTGCKLWGHTPLAIKSIYQQCTNNNADYTDEDFYMVNILHGGSSLYWNSIQLTIKQQALALSARLFLKRLASTETEYTASAAPDPAEDRLAPIRRLVPDF